MEARYQDVLELLQAEGGRIASLQVGPCGMAAGFAAPDSVCAALYVPALILCLLMGGPTWAASRTRIPAPQTSVSIVQQLQEAVSSAASEKGLQTRLPCCMLLHDWSPLAPIYLQETVCSAACEKGLQTPQAQDAFAFNPFHILASILLQEAVSSAASEKGLQTFQAQDALAQQLAMQLQLHEAEAERQVGQS